MKTIYNTYILMQNQEQCDIMKQLCINNELSIWHDRIAFEYNEKQNLFLGDGNYFMQEDNEFFVSMNKTGYAEVTEQEFIELLKNKL